MKEILSIGSRSLTEGHPPSSEINAGVAVDRGKRDEISGVKGTNSGIDISHRLEQEA